MIVAIYLRKSRSDEGLDALNNHRAVLTRLAEQHGFEYVIYEEIGSSVSLDARDKMNELLSNIHLYKFVLVMDLDRLARSMAIMEELKEKFRYHGVQIMTPQQTIDLNNESNEMLMDFQSVLAKAEYQQIRKRMKIGKVEGARRGHWVNGVAPLGYGYDKTVKKLVIAENEYPLVREIFSLALKNMSHMEIAINLNLRGFRTRKGNFFSDGSIKTILNNRAYVGDVVYRQKSKTIDGKDEVIVTHDCHPAIVSEADWLEVLKLSQKRRTNAGKNSTSVKSAVQGLLYCGCCGAKLSINKGNKKDKANPSYFIKGCWKVDEYGNSCPNRAVKLKEVEDAVITEITKYKEVAIKKAQELLSADTSSISDELNKKISFLKSEMAKQEEILSKLLDSYIESIISKEVYTKKKKERESTLDVLKQDIRRLQIQLETLDSEKQITSLKELIRVLDIFERMDVQDSNRFLKSVISKIVITSLPDEQAHYRRAKQGAIVEIEFSG